MEKRSKDAHLFYEYYYALGDVIKWGAGLTLTTVIAHRTTDALVVDWSAAVHMQRTLLHHTGGHVSDAVAQFARFPWVRWDLQVNANQSIKYAYIYIFDVAI